ncbi:DUF4876 domain-containing protein [Empedobacter falsenii]|uniref:DUF4876 domain-containing protein n=1 Tax=Empedobacter falsenii TaxID=343874 RepID=UPI0025757F00|nr:DUF4876 domain-containing protein [Empedobacter falsenii]MDM1298221.1 DUF4876 domain-containing protein [Empedobacter falsenii]MDM1318222.1 DUF4876 domain-containing protein [Empedobacter falsenii]
MLKKYILLTPILASLLFNSCSDDDFGNSAVQPVTFTTKVTFDSDFDASKFPVNAKTTLKNAQTGVTYEAVTNEKGEAIFPQLTPGVYTANVVFSITPAQFEELFGYPADTEDNVEFNGSAQNVTVNSTNISLEIELNSVKTIGGLILKQIYYGGSHIKEGALFRDQFLEIYNNSNEVIYADGLIFGQLFGAYSVESQPYSQPNGQLDWSKGEGNKEGARANTDFVYVANAIRVPGNGTTYPVQPGESITIAQTAINHKGNYTDANGKVIEILKPELTVDLSNADFEVNMTEYLGSQYSYDIQNPLVPDMDIVWWVANKDLILDNLGRQAYILFRAADDEIKGFGKVKNPNNKTTYEYLQLPNKYILDGVETTQDMGSKLVPKKLQNKQDAGYAYLTGGSYTSTSIIRKTQKTINGRIILKDTNNSTNDFVNIKAEPKIFAQ